MDAIRRRAVQLFPHLTGPLVKAATCMYASAPDDHFVIGLLDGMPQVVVACGFSGHGFKFVPVVGEIVADLVQTGTTAPRHRSVRHRAPGRPRRELTEEEIHDEHEFGPDHLQGLEFRLLRHPDRLGGRTRCGPGLVGRRTGPRPNEEDLLLAYADHEAAVERETPTALYPQVLAEAFRRTGAALGKPVSEEWAARLGNSVPDWPAFPDSAGALDRLARRYQLIILSNVHRAGFAGSNRHLRGDFAAVITAEDVGAYKPAANHFRALETTLPELGVDRDQLLHVAQSLFHDHVPAKREGLPSVWINRRHDRPGWGATPKPAGEWSYDLEFGSMGSFADAVDAAFAH